MPDLVVDGVTGVQIERGRGNQIADVIQRVVAHPHRYEKISQAAIDCIPEILYGRLPYGHDRSVLATQGLRATCKNAS